MISPERRIDVSGSPEINEKLPGYRPLRLVPSPDASSEVAKRAQELNTALSLFDQYKIASRYIEVAKDKSTLQRVVEPLVRVGALIDRIIDNQINREVPISNPDYKKDQIFALAGLNGEDKERIESTHRSEGLKKQSARGTNTGLETLTPADLSQLEQLKKDLILDTQMDKLTEEANLIENSFKLGPKPIAGIEDTREVSTNDDIVALRKLLQLIHHDAKQKVTAAKGNLDTYKLKGDPELLNRAIAVFDRYDKTIDTLSQNLHGEIPTENLRLPDIMTTIYSSMDKNLHGVAELEELDIDLLSKFYGVPFRVYFSRTLLDILVSNLTDNSRKSFLAEQTDKLSYRAVYDVTDKEFVIRFEQVGGKLIPERFTTTGYTRGDTEWDDKGRLPGQGLGMYRQVKILEAVNASLKVDYLFDPNDPTVKIGSVHELRFPLVKAEEQS